MSGVSSITAWRDSQFPEHRYPQCWNWTIEEIINYVNSMLGVAYNRYVSEDPRDLTRQESFQEVVHLVLLQCLKERTIYAYTDTRRETFRKCFAAFHFQSGRSVPIGDVYSALGWFLSYCEDPRIMQKKDHRLLICYTRLCYRIAKQIKGEIKDARKNKGDYAPKKTHLLWIESYPVLTASHLGASEILMSLSASLPIANFKALGEQMNPKDTFKELRQDMTRNVAGESVLKRMAKLNPFHTGVCAEGPNHASFTSKEQTTHTSCFGAALTVKHVSNDLFSSYDEIFSHAHVGPCESCREMFKHGRVTLQDTGSFKIFGQLPPGTNVLPQFAEANTPDCMVCHQYKDPMAKDYCKPYCRHLREVYKRDGYDFPAQPPSYSHYAPQSTSQARFIPGVAGTPDPMFSNYISPANGFTRLGRPSTERLSSFGNAHRNWPDGYPHGYP